MREEASDGKALRRYQDAVRRIAIYDMDKTITRSPTYARFLVHAVKALKPWRLLLAPVTIVTSVLYLLKAIDRARLKELNQWLLLGSVRPDALATVAESFAERTLATNILPGAVARLAADKAEGYALVLATASYRLYAATIAARLGFDDVVATNSLAGLDARIRPKIDGENCYGPAKLRMIEAWMAGEGIDRADADIRFYTDHASDAPALEWADEAFAVNAHDQLLRLAAERRWTVLDWR